jgi:gluconolactonase
LNPFAHGRPYGKHGENNQRNAAVPLAPIALESLRKIGVGLDRPEDVVVLRDGRVFASDHQCAVAQIHPDGSFTRLGPRRGAPNGINADAQGRILIANFGIYDGKPGPLERFDPASGLREIIADAVGGLALTASNYPILDSAGNIWCANSTHAPTWPEALDGRDDGFLYVIRPSGEAEIVAVALQFPNGLALSADERTLYCCQTSAADVLAFPIYETARGRLLGEPERHGPALGPLLSGPYDPANPPPAEVMHNLGYTDGCGMDAEGNLWVTLPAANKIVAITPDGGVVTVVHDTQGAVLNHPTNIAWGGDDLRDLYIGSIRADYVVTARSPVPGLPLAHQR